MSNSQMDVRYIADLARIELSEEECTTFQPQLDAIVGYIDKLLDADIEGIEPTAHAIPVYNHLREDESKPGITQQDFLRNAPDSALDQIRVPKVVDA